ncbi:hypothetical protein GUJ93_ZPchr0006g45047 [Zizania palustris]|uniref:Uncharacterized protein n=1 Tax=Zizania palustris TaxID=103762 RepID=A0A8J5S863_ZIZPA|nr:hypothetical protein GUJ93_ZPchr0006g45047 [Zizania palustris]
MGPHVLRLGAARVGPVRAGAARGCNRGLRGRRHAWPVTVAVAWVQGGCCGGGAGGLRSRLARARREIRKYNRVDREPMIKPIVDNGMVKIKKELR